MGKRPVIASAVKARGNPEIFFYSLNWIASSLTLLAMTVWNLPSERRASRRKYGAPSQAQQLA